MARGVPDYNVTASSASSTSTAATRRRKNKGNKATTKRKPKADLLALSKRGNKTAKKALGISISLQSGANGMHLGRKGNAGKVTKTEPKTTTLTNTETGEEYEHTSKAQPF